MTTALGSTKDNLMRSHKIYTLESAGSDDITSIATEGLSEFFSDARHHLLNVFSKSGRYMGDASPVPSLVKKVTTMDKGAIEKLNIPCVTGFNGGDSYAYMRSLDTLRKHYCDTLLNKVLKPFNAVLGYYINNPSKLGLLSRSELLSSVKLNNVSLGRKELLSYNNGKLQATLPFFDVYRTQSDFASVGAGINQLMYDLEKNNDDTIAKTIEDCSDKLNVLIGYLQGEFGQKYNISKTVSSDLSNFTLQIAEECEFYSLIRFSATAFANAYKDQIEFFKDL